MSNPEDIRIATAIAAAEAQVRADITNYVLYCIPDAGDVLCRCPLFKAGKPISKYATVRDDDHPDAETSWKEVVVTSNFSIKLVVTLKQDKKKAKNKKTADAEGADADDQGDDQQQVKFKTKILTEWVSPLTSVVSVVPRQPASDADRERGAEFCVLFLAGNKDIKQAKDDKIKIKIINKEGRGTSTTATATAADDAVNNYRDDALRYLAPHHAVLAAKSAENRPESVQREMDQIEQEHLDHLTQELKFPSLRCRAYVVPDALGGSATRDKWVETYRTAVFNSWRNRLKCPQKSNNIDITCVRFAEVTMKLPPTCEAKVKENDNQQQQQAEQQQVLRDLSAIVAFEDKSCFIVPVVRSGALTCTSQSLVDAVAKYGLFIPTPFSVDRPDAFAPFRIQVSRGADVAANLEFFTNAHADAFSRCTEQNDSMVMSFSI